MRGKLAIFIQQFSSRAGNSTQVSSGATQPLQPVGMRDPEEQKAEAAADRGGSLLPRKEIAVTLRESSPHQQASSRRMKEQPQPTVLEANGGSGRDSPSLI